ncbi:MAG: ATP-dependent 6-phosphofructokinase [Armatimonadetes bacterium]|nr:ATP-dependent 6-phosphofructokinase [Armatimonadota bacterium]
MSGKKTKKIAVLTGGGDVPGLNPCIRTLVNLALDRGYEVIGFRRGWLGPLMVNPDDPSSVDQYVMNLDRIAVRTIHRMGGTFLHSSRTNPQRVKEKAIPEFLKPQAEKYKKEDGLYDFTPHVLRALEYLGVDALVPIGGDDTLSYAHRLHKEGFHVVAVPKTMDNDVYGTDYCLGFSTAITRTVEFIHQLRTSTGSHERIAVIELFGRNSGETSLISSYLSGADRCIICEVPFNVEKLGKLLVKDKKENPSNYSMVVVSEGAVMEGGDVIETGEEDPYGHRKLGGVGLIRADRLKKVTGEETLYQQIGYLMRSGAPDSLDLMVSTNYATMAINLIDSGTSNRMVNLRNGTYGSVPIDMIMDGLKRVDVDELYDVEEYRPCVRNIQGKPMFLY